MVGLHKQSVEDAERLMSHAVATFMRSKGYTEEAQYVKVIADWHEAPGMKHLMEEAYHNSNKVKSTDK